MNSIPSRLTKAPRRASNRQGGYTLVEAMTVIVLIAVTMGVSIPVVGKLYAFMKFRTAVEALVGEIQLAKMKAVNENATVTLSISTADRTYQIQNEEIRYLPNTVSFTGNPPASLVFNALGRLTSGLTVTINLIGSKGDTATVTINPSGRITTS